MLLSTLLAVVVVFHTGPEAEPEVVPRTQAAMVLACDGSERPEIAGHVALVRRDGRTPGQVDPPPASDLHPAIVPADLDRGRSATPQQPARPSAADPATVLLQVFRC